MLSGKRKSLNMFFEDLNKGSLSDKIVKDSGSFEETIVCISRWWTMCFIFPWQAKHMNTLFVTQILWPRLTTSMIALKLRSTAPLVRQTNLFNGIDKSFVVRILGYDSMSSHHRPRRLVLYSTVTQPRTWFQKPSIDFSSCTVTLLLRWDAYAFIYFFLSVQEGKYGAEISSGNLIKIPWRCFLERQRRWFGLADAKSCISQTNCDREIQELYQTIRSKQKVKRGWFSARERAASLLTERKAQERRSRLMISRCSNVCD